LAFWLNLLDNNLLTVSQMTSWESLAWSISWCIECDMITLCTSLIRSGTGCLWRLVSM
jgi:hypothetical protein